MNNSNHKKHRYSKCILKVPAGIQKGITFLKILIILYFVRVLKRSLFSTNNFTFHLQEEWECPTLFV
nr:MAG TPA: hypothetical protein [Caudoviricetes sp.]